MTFTSLIYIHFLRTITLDEQFIHTWNRNEMPQLARLDRRAKLTESIAEQTNFDYKSRSTTCSPRFPTSFIDTTRPLLTDTNSAL